MKVKLYIKLNTSLIDSKVNKFYYICILCILQQILNVQSYLHTPTVLDHQGILHHRHSNFCHCGQEQH